VSRIYLSPPHMSGAELDFVGEAFASNWIAPLGPHVDAFENEFAAAVGVAHGAALSSGTAALHLALLLVDVESGDEVLCPTLTFAATANAITYVGAEPVFVDSTDRSWNIDPDLVAAELESCARRNRIPRALIAVDLYGQCADFDRLENTCAEYGVALIEDAAEALGATYRGRPAGSFGQIAAFSFNGNKIITTSGGGMLVSDDPGFTDRARFLASQARDPAPHYQHSTIGFNYRMSNVLAAIGRAQLQVLTDRVEKRRENFDHYYRELGQLPGLSFMAETPYGRCTRWLTCLTIDPREAGVSREEVRLALEAENIEARPVWKPMHLQPAFAGRRVREGSVSERLFRDGLCLPSGTTLTSKDLERVVAVVHDVFDRRRQ